jgi:RecA-family ATPase
MTSDAEHDAPLTNDPAAGQALTAVILALNRANGQFAKLKAVRDGVEMLEPFGEDDAIGHLSDLAIDAHGLEPDDVQTAIAHGLNDARVKREPRAHKANGAEPPPPNGPEDYGAANSGNGASAAPDSSPQPPLQWLDMSTWDHEPIPERQWAILNRVPLYPAGLFSGEGGAGKSMIELHKDVAHVAGRDWLGSLPERGPAFYIGAEDDKLEIHIRLAAIAKHCEVTFAQLVRDGLRVLPLLGQDATLCFVGKGGKVETTGLYKQLYEAAGDIKPKNIGIDTLSRAFAGNEIDRVQVYGFAMHMQALAMVAGGAVTILSHPSLSGINSGSGISGSTAWHGAFRFRQYLKGVKAADGEQPDNDLRELEFKKNQYGPTAETIVLRYQRGLFLPVAGMASLDKVAQEARADGVFLDLLHRFTKENRNVGERTGTSYAPARFAQEEEAKRAALTSKHLEAAMRRLFKAEKIWNEPYGRPARISHRLAIKA